MYICASLGWNLVVLPVEKTSLHFENELALCFPG